MKCDHRWYNDGRLEREKQALCDRDKAPADVTAYWKARTAAFFELTFEAMDVLFDVEVRGSDEQWVVRCAPKSFHGARLRVALPGAV